MARTVTATAVKRIITKGLSGWQAGKLVLQDLVDSYLRRESVLTEADMAAIGQMRMEGADVRDYNMFMALSRGFYRGCMVAELASKDACLQIGLLERALQDAEKCRTVELFESFGPRVVTRTQYEEIVAAQRKVKLAFKYGLGYVVEQRFYAIAPPEAKAATDGACVDIESLADLVGAVPEEYSDHYEQAVEQIRQLHARGMLPVVYDKEDEKQIKASLGRWRKDRLSPEEVADLVDRLYVTGQTLYGCADLPEWKAFMDQYQQHWLTDDDERFRHAYAVLGDCPAVWLDSKGCYKGPTRPSRWITHGTELFLGLSDRDDRPGRPVEQVGAELRERLAAIEENIRVFLAVKAVLDMAVDTVELDVPRDGGVLARAEMRLGAFIAVYNLHLENLTEESKLRRTDETRLEKVLKMLSPIDADGLKPSPDSLTRLGSKILGDACGEEWLWAKLRSLQCGDGVNLADLLD